MNTFDGKQLHPFDEVVFACGDNSWFCRRALRAGRALPNPPTSLFLGVRPRAFALVMTARVLSRWTVMVVLLPGFFFFFFLFAFAVNWGEAPSTLIFFADAGMIG